MPRIWYTCDQCEEGGYDVVCRERDDLRVVPDGRLMCECCFSEMYEYPPDTPKDERKSWVNLPKPDPLTSVVKLAALLDELESDPDVGERWRKLRDHVLACLRQGT